MSAFHNFLKVANELMPMLMFHLATGMDDIIDMEVGICSPSYADPDPKIFLHGDPNTDLQDPFCTITPDFFTFLHSLFKHTLGSKTFFL
jgi:hypothetical protein